MLPMKAVSLSMTKNLLKSSGVNKFRFTVELSVMDSSTFRHLDEE